MQERVALRVGRRLGVAVSYWKNIEANNGNNQNPYEKVDGRGNVEVKGG